MNKLYKFSIFSLLALVSVFAFAQDGKVLQIFKDGKVIREYSVSDIDYIEIVERAASPSYVDLGLPSGVKWATFNVGAVTPGDMGEYFAWGEVSSKTSYSSSNSSTHGKSMKDISGTSYDVARAKWGSDWRMPTSDEMDELSSKCTWTWTTMDGNNGYKVTGPNGNSIFLPAAGYMKQSTLNSFGTGGYYWSSTPYTNNNYAYYLGFSKSSHNIDMSFRYGGYSVRPVHK